MGTYQDEIFEYFTKKENFISAYEIYQQYPEIKNKLLVEFWNLVKINLECVSKDAAWNVELSEDVFYKYSRIDLWTNELIYPRYHALSGKLAIGLLIDIEHDNFSNLDRGKIDNYSKSLETLTDIKRYPWWLGWAQTNHDFDNIETLKRILPELRDDFANELADELYNFGEELKDDIKKMLKMTKK